MKKDKHILINLTQDEYNALLRVAASKKRTPTNTAYLLLIDPLLKEIANLCDLGSSDFKKIDFNA